MKRLPLLLVLVASLLVVVFSFGRNKSLTNTVPFTILSLDIAKKVSPWQMEQRYEWTDCFA